MPLNNISWDELNEIKTKEEYEKIYSEKVGSNGFKRSTDSIFNPSEDLLSYDKILDAHGKVAELFTQRVSDARNYETIIVDMTNMNSGSRKSALNAIKGFESEYKKIAVVFKFKGSEDLIKQVAKKRAEEAKKIGKSKTIPDTAFDRMFQSYQEVTPDEGFDEVIEVDNTSTLKSVLEIKENVKWLKSFSNFRKN
jgi:hypothetical protein